MATATMISMYFLIFLTSSLLVYDEFYLVAHDISY